MAILLLSGCSATPPSTPPSAFAATSAPTYDPASDIWLIDGWPVPDPHASFDPNAPYLSPQESERLLMTCMQGKGWDLSPSEDGGFSGRVPEAQREVYQSDLKACAVENRLGIDPVPPLDATLAKSEYAAEVAARECLLNRGIEVPELPSYAAYEEALLTKGISNGIYPLASAAGIDLFTDPTIRAACPDPSETFGRN